MESCPARFYDGYSARPHEVDLRLETGLGELHFRLGVEQSIKWPLEEVRFESIGSHLEIRRGKDPMQTLKVEDSAFIEAFKETLHKQGHTGWYQQLLDAGIGTHMLLAVIVMGIVVLIYLFGVPPIAERAAVLIPEAYENSLGANFFEEYIKYEVMDTALSEKLTAFTDRMELRNSKPLYFTVVESGLINAFALPDGNIVVFTGIIDQMDSYEELAALIGHEAVHVNERHSIKMLCRNLAGYLVISVMLSDVNGIMAIVAENAHSLNSLSYSRHFEREADMIGTEILRDNRINPRGMSDLFGKLHSHSGDTEEFIPEFLSSHPLTKERIAYINEQIADDEDIVENVDLREIFDEMKHMMAGGDY